MFTYFQKKFASVLRSKFSIKWSLLIPTLLCEIQSYSEQDRQALLKAKYCLWGTAVSCTQKNHVTLTYEYDLEIQ